MQLIDDLLNLPEFAGGKIDKATDDLFNLKPTTVKQSPRLGLAELKRVVKNNIRSRIY